MNEIEALQGLRNAHINDTYKGQRLSLVLTNAIEALQEKQDRDNMRCVNCKQYGACDTGRFCDIAEPTDYCSYFELKEQVKSNEK